MLKNYNEEDFKELTYVACDRLDPGNVPVFLLAAIGYSGVCAGVSLFAVKQNIKYSTGNISNAMINFNRVSLIILAIQIAFAIFYLFPKNNYKFQRLQCIVLSIVAFKISIEGYQPMYFFWADRHNPYYQMNIQTLDNMYKSGILIFIGGIVFLIYCVFRAINRVEKGCLRDDGRGLYDFAKSDKRVNIPIIYVCTMLGGSIAKSLSNGNTATSEFWELLFGILIFAFIQYAMALALPEFFLLTYCKLRFKYFIVSMPKKYRKRVKK
ncbi:MAG: hypothetical protein ACERKV_11775 [Clostridiaceae bacterium]